MQRGTPFVHLVARARLLPVQLHADEVAYWLWPRLREAFPLSFAAVIMPNHLHLVSSVASDTSRGPERARVDLARLVGGLTRSGGVRGQIRFEPVPEAPLQDDPSKLLRQARYAALNPTRARLVDDPLAWSWSTHRDVLGIVHDPWVTAARLAAAVGRSPDGFARWWHAYVTRDDTVVKLGTSFPTAATHARFATVPIESVARAVAHATRSPVTAVRRRGRPRELFLAAAARVGWRQTDLLAEYCDMAQRSVQEALARPAPALDAVMLCLGDPRLR